MRTTTQDPPEAYLGVPVPPEAARQWRRWPAAEWRKIRWQATNRLYPPDERFNIEPPPGMCSEHLRIWHGYRNQLFNPRTGDRWPGLPGSPFTILGRNIVDELAWRRCEWDDKAAEQMRLTEETCLSGRSAQCGDRRDEQQPSTRGQAARRPARARAHRPGQRATEPAHSPRAS